MKRKPRTFWICVFPDSYKRRFNIEDQRYFTKRKRAEKWVEHVATWHDIIGEVVESLEVMK